MSFAEEFRELVPVTKNLIYLNHAAISPTPLPVLYEAYRYLSKVAELGSLAVNEYEQDDFKTFRENVAKLFNVDWDEISFVPNTSFGINVVVHGLEMKEGDKVVTDSLEFPAVTDPLYKLEKKGIKVEIVTPRLEDFEDEILRKIDSRTRLVAISHVSFNTGVRVDYSKIAKEVHSVGGFLLLDVIQSAGAVRVNLQDVDFATAGGYKWLMSPQGSGFLYVRKGLIEDPPFYGWRTSKYYLEFNALKFEIDKGPRRFELGTLDVSAVAALAKSAEILSGRIEEVEERVLALSGYAIERLKEEGFEVITPDDRQKRAGIVVFKVKDPQEKVRELAKRKIIVSQRGPGIRVSTHFYNTYEEIEKFIDELKKLSV